jgi:hypothetical protein
MSIRGDSGRGHAYRQNRRLRLPVRTNTVPGTSSGALATVSILPCLLTTVRAQ